MPQRRMMGRARCDDGAFMIAAHFMEFLRMGGYAGFVWPAYGAAALVMGALLVQSLHRYRKAQRALADLQGRRPRRRGTP